VKIEEGRNNFIDRLARTIDMAFDFDDLPNIAVGDGGDVSLCIAHIR